MTSRSTYILSGHAGRVRGVTFAPRQDGSAQLITYGEDGTVRLWDPHTGTNLHVLDSRMDEPFSRQADWLPEEDHQYDLHHWHPDFYGEGNRTQDLRERYVRVLFEDLDRIKAIFDTWTDPAQVWIMMDESDSSMDACYVHSPNPNADNFPHRFEDVHWDVDGLPPWLARFVDPARHQVGRTSWRGDTVWTVRLR